MHRGWSGAGIGGKASSRFLKKYKSRDESRDLYNAKSGIHEPVGENALT